LCYIFKGALPLLLYAHVRWVFEYEEDRKEELAIEIKYGL
jgi:hypothetical protein